ncbi:hypothetical protein SELMODRAFT_87550 [Selaginella moellendorffii]|uniref:Importin N-terminal domain-containing protein n=1 Tax=Selaginella moellendorffii TaxID=88036 RepID=D8R8Q0_SELML|nr:hypothetical protein SELMODRAFT_87550 [Selaginella moellendorffii]
MESLAQLEALCDRLYNSQDPAERAHAESTLQCFSTNLDYISQCQLILESSSSPYAQLLASSSLLKQVTNHTLALQLRIDIRNYILSYLASKGQELQAFVIISLIQLLCRITKLGWNDDDRFKEITKEAMKFMSQATVEHFYIGLRILNQLVQEMNQPNPCLSLAHHRKIACFFRDSALLQIFQISLTSLGQLKRDADDRLRQQAMGLALKCLSFDFVGTSQDESSEELGTIQIPSSWKGLLEDMSTINLFFDYYAISKPPLSNQALECLVQLASIRRALFSGETERMKFLSHLLSGTREILRTQQGLSEHVNYHEYCRLLGRLKTNYQLSELISVENYNDWIRLVAEFTIRSFQSWQWASGSVYYLLGLWSRLVSSVPYLKSNFPSLLDAYVPKITEAYITSRFDSVQQAIVQNNLAEDPLDNEEHLQDQLDSLPFLCRFQYERSSAFILQLLDPILQSFTEASRVPNPAEGSRLSIIEGQLTWLVHIIGSIIKIRQNSASSAEVHEVIDGELSARVFQLLQVTDSGSHVQRYGERSKQRLDIALLSFFQHFRKVYVGEHSSKQLYARLSELGVQDNLVALNIIVAKIATDLKCYAQCEDVIQQALNLFQELPTGYMSGKLLLKLDAVNFILANHTREHFSFLDEPSNSRHRTTFYFTIGRLVFMEDSVSRFRTAIAPLQQVFLSLEATPDSAFRSDAVKYTIVGLMRDLRGITMATNSRKTFTPLFDWLYPAHFSVIIRALGHWVDTPEVTTPLLKFMAEFVVNKTQRLTFESSSPNGILLFREISKLLVAYGNGIMALPTPSDIYAYKYKGIWIALVILTRALGGNYVNFGVFELYGDPALADALDVALKMSFSIPLADIAAYRKVARSYYAFFEVLCHHHLSVIVNLDTPTFSHVLGSLEAGLKSLDASISSQCASAVDNMSAYYFTHITLGESPTSPMSINFARHIQERPNIFPQLLKSLFELVLFEECSNQWSISRPILALILINEQAYTDIKIQIIASQVLLYPLVTRPPDSQQKLLLGFEKLMTDVNRTLEPTNREKFTQNLTIFRHDFLAK